LAKTYLQTHITDVKGFITFGPVKQGQDIVSCRVFYVCYGSWK